MSEKDTADEISIVWSVEDVQSEDASLTKEEAREILASIKHSHDACIGVNWDVINFHISQHKDAKKS